jgi:hypothetical protein
MPGITLDPGDAAELAETLANVMINKTTLTHRALDKITRITPIRGLHLTGVGLRPTLQNPQVRPGFRPATPTLAAGR